MKVTHQNGAAHGLTRKEAEAIVALLPQSLTGVAKSLVLYAGGDRASVGFHRKEGIVALRWSSEAPSLEDKAAAIEELVIALSVIAEAGDLPEHLKASARGRHAESRHRLIAEIQESIGAVP